MVYTVTLNPALDYYVNINELRQDVQIASSTKILYGGKGLNVSVVLKNLGIESTALGFVGGFSGQKLVELVDNEGICTSFVTIENDTRINVKITGAKNLTINSNGPSITLNNEQQLIEKLYCIKDGDYLVLSGSIPSSMGEGAYERILNNLSDKKINLVVDTTGNALISTLKYRPLLIKPNNFELEEIVKRPLGTRNKIISAAKDLQKMGVRNVLVSLGKNGMLLLDENSDVNFEPIIDGEVKNTTGCGDSTVAGFIAGYIKKQNYRYALKVANACSNATAFSTGLASKSEIEKLM